MKNPCFFFELRVAHFTIGFFTLELFEECSADVQRLVARLCEHSKLDFHSGLPFPCYLGTKVLTIAPKFALTFGDFAHNDGTGLLDNALEVGDNLKLKTYFGTCSFNVNISGQITSSALSVCLHEQPVMVFNKYVFARVKVGLELLSELECFPLDSKQRPTHAIYVADCGIANPQQIKEFAQYNNKIQSHLLENDLYLIDALVKTPQLFRSHEKSLDASAALRTRFVEELKANYALNLDLSQFR